MAAAGAEAAGAVVSVAVAADEDGEAGVDCGAQALVKTRTSPKRRARCGDELFIFPLAKMRIGIIRWVFWVGEDQQLHYYFTPFAKIF